MESGEKELRKVFEDTTTNNVKAILAHNNETRKMTRELIEKVEHLERTMRQYDEKLQIMQNQITNLQAKVYAGGTNG